MLLESLTDLINLFKHSLIFLFIHWKDHGRWAVEYFSSWWTLSRTGAVWNQPSRGRGLGCRSPQPILGVWRWHAYVSPTPFIMSSVTQQRNHRSEIRDEAKKKKKRETQKTQPSKMFSFPGGISLSCCSFLCQGIQEALGLGSAVTLQSGFSGAHPPSWLLPGPGGQHQAFFLSGLRFWAARGPSSPAFLSLFYIVNPEAGPRLSEFKFCLYLLYLCDFDQVMSPFLFGEVGMRVYLRVKIIKLCKALRP